MGIELINDKKKIVLYLNTILIISFIWVIFVNTSYFFEKTVFGEHELYSDLKLIHNNFVDYLANKNPYEFDSNFWPKGSIPPFILKTFSSLGKIEFQIVKNYFIVLEIISLILLLYYSYKLFPLKKVKYLYPLIYFFSFNFSNGSSVMFGNDASILYSMIGIGIIFLYKEKILIFMILVLIASLFKFHYFLFYFLPFLLYGWKSLKYIVPFFLFIILVYFFSYLDDKELFNSWLDILNVIILRNVNNPWAGVDITQIFINILWYTGQNLNINLYPNYFISNIFWFLFTFISFISIFFIFHNKNINNEKKLKILSLGILTITLFYPRLIFYDFFLIVPVYYYLTRTIRFFEDKNRNIAIKFILFLFFLVVQDSHTAITALSLLFFLIVYSEFKNNDPLLINKKIS